MARPELKRFTLEEIRNRAKWLRFYAQQLELLAEIAHREDVGRPVMDASRGVEKGLQSIAKWLASGVRHVKRSTGKSFQELGDGEAVYPSDDGTDQTFEPEPMTVGQFSTVDENVSQPITGNNRKRSKITAKSGKKHG